ncbi:MAG: CDP-glycerol glycerophosphotransferase family protein [Castellaniella sp.]|uniref:CDP-glycerol glycerophosphotransferase family protein n=1 Tax=Castellaniella sp. TaxID=1955812 RepID=UPI003C74C2EB
MARFIFLLLHPLWQLIDRMTPKRADCWAFSTHHLHTGRFIENQRAMFELVKRDPGIHKIVFYRGEPPDLRIEDAIRYRVLRHGTLRGLLWLARCKVVFLTHSVSMDYSLRWPGGRFSILKLSMRHRIVVNLWHGIPLKRLLYAANDATSRHTSRIQYRTTERRKYAGLIASSDIDSYAMASMFYPLNYHQIWNTGLPRNDFLTQAEELLPSYIQDSLRLIRAKRQGKKLVIYAPTYRQTAISDGAHYYQFSAGEIERLKSVLHSHDAVLGYRPHYFKNSTNYFNMDEYVDDVSIFDMSQDAVPEFSALARECGLLVTDYSSVYIEALYLDKPIICFGYDIEHYKAHEDGLLYDMELAFPGPIAQDFGTLIEHIDEALRHDGGSAHQQRATARKIFFKYNDSMNSERVRREIVRRLENEA